MTTSGLDDSSEVESELDYSNTCSALLYADNCDMIRVERLIKAKA
jgi:hypothetical protein